MVQDIFSRKLWATAFQDKSMSNVTQALRTLFADNEKPKELNADGEFDNPTINGFFYTDKKLLRAIRKGDKTLQR